MDYTNWDDDMLTMKREDYYTLRGKHKSMIENIDKEMDEVEAEMSKRRK